LLCSVQVCGHIPSPVMPSAYLHKKCILKLYHRHLSKCSLFNWSYIFFITISTSNSCSHSVQNLLYSSLLSKNIKIKIYRTIILPVALYGCEAQLLTLREEHRLTVFKNRLLRRIFEPKRGEVTVEWRKLHNEELSDP